MVTAVTGPAYLSRTAATAPGTSVFSATQPPESERTSVLATPDSDTTGDTEDAYAAASGFSGAVTDSPRHSSPSPETNDARSPRGTCTASYVHDDPSAAYPARCSTGDNEWETGSPRTAHRISSVRTGCRSSPRTRP